MRTSLAPFRLLIALPILVPMLGCGGGGATSPAPMPAAQASAPQPSGYSNDGYSNDGYSNDGYGNDGYGNGGYSNDGYGNDAGESSDNSEAGTADDSGYGDANNDGYANASPGYGDSGYGNAGGGNTSPGYEGYGGGYDNTGYGNNANDSGTVSAQQTASDDYASAYAAEGGYEVPADNSDSVFADQVQPILQARCYSCHGGGPRSSKGDLELHTVAAISSSGVVNSSRPDDSELLIRIKLDSGDENRMPPKGPSLTPEEIGIIEAWVKSGVNSGGGGGYGYGDGQGYVAAGDSGAAGYGSDGVSQQSRPAPPKNLAEAASVSFRRGHDRDAMNQLYAQTLVPSDAAQSVLEAYRWVPGLKRAKLAVRWGVGVKYNPKGGYKGSPRPPGVHQNLPGDDRDSGSSEDEVDVSDFRNEALDYYAGDIGDELLLRLQNRIEAGYYGPLLQGELEKALVGSGDEFGDDGFDSPYEDADSGFGGGYGGGGYGSSRDGSSGGSREKPDGERIEQIMPGVTMLGEASQAVLFERATQQGVDLLVIFDVVSDANRRIRVVNSSTRVRLYDVPSKAQLAVTGTIRNVELQRTRAENEDDETIINEMGKLFDVADKTYKAKEFPAEATEKAKSGVIKLVQALIDQPSENPLWKLGEVRFYQSRGLLKDSHAASAINKIVPQQAAELAAATDEKQVRSVLSEWLVAQETGNSTEEVEEDRGPRREFR